MRPRNFFNFIGELLLQLASDGGLFVEFIFCQKAIYDGGARQVKHSGTLALNNQEVNKFKIVQSLNIADECGRASW